MSKALCIEITVDNDGVVCTVRRRGSLKTAALGVAFYQGKGQKETVLRAIRAASRELRTRA